MRNVVGFKTAHISNKRHLYGFIKMNTISAHNR